MSKGKRKTSVVAMMAVLASLLLPVLAAAPAQAVDPDHVSNTLQGCKPTAGSYQTTPQVICTNNSNYTTGNLGKSWNELDLVPYRLTQSAGNAAPANQTYSVSIVLDAVDGNPDRPGYDVISAPVLNTALSDDTPGPTGNCSFTVSNQQTKVPGFGGIEQSIYRVLTITQAKNTTCVYDYYGRLAVGAHLFPGSSLHANVANEAVTQGGSDVSIPVKEIAPQAINKTMTAVQDSDFAWTINKGVAPDHLQFGNVCDTTNLDTTLQTDVTITWTKVPGDAQDITVHTLVEASNPAARVITVQVSDQLFSGVNPIGAPKVGLPVDVPANTTGTDVLDYTTTVPAGTTNLHDVATATYTDKLTGVPVPGNTIATASASVQGGNVTNGTATITDVENISGAGLSFTVDSVTGDAAALNGATLNGSSPGPVTWTSGTVSAGGSVVLHKTVTLDASVGATSGALTDTATVTGSDGFTTSANEQVDLDSTLSGSLTINKSTTVPVDADTTFTFNVTGPGGFDTDVFVKVLKGATTSTTAGTLSNLAAGDYNVEETDSGPFDPGADQQFTIGAGAKCTATLNFENSFGLATATALKVTDPAGGEEGWTFQLYLDKAPAGAGAEDTLVASDQTDSSGLADFGQITDEGSYYILEVNQAGYVSDGGKNCSFVVDYPADKDKQFDDCVFTNTKNGSITIAKVTSPSPDLTGTSFPFTRSFGPNVSLKNGESSKISDLAPGTYSAAEQTPAGWTLSSFTCDDQSPVTAIDLNPGEDIICTATNVEQTASIIVKKVTEPASDTDTEFTFDTSYKGDFKLKNGGSDNSGPLSVNGGPYSVAEINVPAGWDLKSLTCDGNNPDPTSINLENNEVVTCTATNVQRGTIIVKKVTDPAGSNKTFVFTGDAAGTIGDGGEITVGNLVPGTYTSSETVPNGWDLTKIECNDSDSTGTGNTATFKLQAGETVRCTFTNKQQPGQIIIAKVTDPASSSQKFSFDTSYGPDLLLGNGESNDSGALPIGQYSAAEINIPQGWDLKSFTCNDANSTPATINLEANETVTCTATNVQRGAIDLTKTFNGAVPPAGSSFTFTLRTGASQGVAGIVVTPPGVVTLNSGNSFHFAWGNLVPGNYQLCESEVPAGGHSSLSDLPGAFVPDLLDNSTQCAPLTVGAGQTVTITVDNTPPPGGDQRTIGYWKNHASCKLSNGKQAPVLDQTLYAATQAGNTIVMGTLPLPGGATANNAGTSCVYARNILDKTTIDGKKKMASDPLFNMAAQLLAAKLNVVAGAGTCPAATTAITQGQALLVKYGWNGLTYSPKLTAADATAANNLNGILDSYNNGNLCP